MFPKLNPALGQPKYANLSVEQGNIADSEIERQLPEAEYKVFRELRRDWRGSLHALLNTTLAQGGMPDPTLIAALDAAEGKYFPLLHDCLDRPEFAYLRDAYSRTVFDITPPRFPNKHNLANSIGVWTAAMWDIWPGTDRAHLELLIRHQALYHFPRMIAGYGGVFVTPPGATQELIDGVLDDLEDADPHWPKAPQFLETTPIKDVRDVFSHFEDDWAAVVVNGGGKILGVLDQKMIHDASDKDLVIDVYDRSGFTPLTPGNPEDDAALQSLDGAYDYMKRRSKQQIFRMSAKNEPLILPLSHAVMASFLLPFRHRKGLGCVVYIGVHDEVEAFKLIRHVVQRGVAGVQIEAANGFMGSMEAFLQKVREEFPDLFIGTGAINMPEAVRRYADIVDVVKGPIGTGGVCNTNDTGHRRPDAYGHIMLALASAGKVPILADGLGGEKPFDPRFLEQQYDDTSEWVIANSIPWTIGKQAGGAMMGRIESGNPLVEHLKMMGKIANGEASANSNLRRQKGKRLNPEQQKRKDARAVYSEGVNNRFYPLRQPPDIARFFDLLAFRLRSSISYALGMKLPKAPPGQHMTTYQSTVEVTHIS